MVRPILFSRRGLWVLGASQIWESTLLMKKEPSLFAKIFLAMITPWTSQRLWLAITCILTLVSLFWTAVYYLYSIPPTHVAAFDSMFQTIAWGVVVVVVGYILDMPTLLNGFKREAVATTANVVNKIMTKEETKVCESVTVTEKAELSVEKKYADKYATDESYRPIATVPDLGVEEFR